jgi:hypothetical protein
MRFHKRSLRGNLNLLWQSSFVFLVISLFLLAMHFFAHADTTLGIIGATSLASTTFLLFVAHDTVMARIPRMLSGYLLAIIVGAAGSFFLHHQLICDVTYCALTPAFALSAGFAIFILTLLMNIFDCQHPPAAGLTIGLVLRDWNLEGLIIIGVFILLLALLKKLLRPYLVNLL